MISAVTVNYLESINCKLSYNVYVYVFLEDACKFCLVYCAPQNAVSQWLQ